MNLELIIKNYQEYENDLTIQNYIAQANSRYILYYSLEPKENFPHYTKELDERCLHIAFSYLNLGWNFYDGDNKHVSLYCIEKASGILEHLYAYDHCDKDYKEYYGLICALAYYVASQYSKAFIVLKNYACDTDIARMIQCFILRGGFVVGMPTSSGKTKVAEISLVKTLSQYPEALCIYLAPFRSLANEIELGRSLALGAIGYTVSHLYGSTQSTQLDRSIHKIY